MKLADPRSFFVLLLTVFSYGVVNNVVFSLLPLMGIELGFSPAKITLIGSIAALMLFLVSPFWGRQSDKHGRRNTILFGMVGYSIAAGLFAFVFSLGFDGTLTGWVLYVLLILTRILQAVLLAAMLPATTAYIIDITSAEQRTTGMSRMSAAHGIGAIAGPSLVSFAIFGLLWPLYIAVIFTIIVALLVTFFLVEPKKAQGKDYKNNKLSYFDPRYRHILLIGFLVYLSMAVVTQTLGLYLPELLNLSTTEAAKPLGMTQSVMAFAMVFAQLFLVQRLQWSPERLLSTGVPFIAVGFCILSLATNLWHLQFAALSIGLGLGLAGPGYSSAVSLCVEPEEQGAVSGLISACPALGFVAGPICAGLLYELSPQLPYILTTGIMLLLTLAVWLVFNKASNDP